MTHEERDEMGRQGAIYYQKELSLAAGASRFEKLFHTIARKL